MNSAELGVSGGVSGSSILFGQGKNGNPGGGRGKQSYIYTSLREI